MGNNDGNILKVRDDHDYIVLVGNKDSNNFTIETNQTLNWCADKLCSKNDLRSRIEPWLTSLFQSEHLSLLIGSGLTTAIQYAACGSADNGMNNGFDFSYFSEEIEKAARDSANKAGRKIVNIEDRVRVANEVIKGLTILHENDDLLEITPKLKSLQNDLERMIKEFSNNISTIEASIANANYKEREEAFNKLVLFLMSFASRAGTRDRLNIFTTNYDRLIEAGADVAGLRLIDRFVGALSPVFRSSRMDIDMHYNPPGIRGEPRYLEGVARFTKLH